MFDQCPIFSEICEPFFYQATTSGTSAAVTLPAANGTNKAYITLANENLYALTAWRAQTNYDNAGGLVDTEASSAVFSLPFQPNNFDVLIEREQSNILMSSQVSQAQIASAGSRGGKQMPYPVIYSPNQTFNFTFTDLTNFFLTLTNQSTAVALAIKFMMEGYHIRQELWDEFLYFRPQLFEGYAQRNAGALCSPGVLASSPQMSNICDQFIWQTTATIASNVVAANTARAQIKTLSDQWFCLTGFRGSTNYDNVQQFTTASTAAALYPTNVPNNFEVEIQRGSFYNLQKYPVPQAVICSSGYRDGSQLPWAILYPPSTTFDFVFYNVAPQLLLTTGAVAIDLKIKFGLQGFNIPKENLNVFMSQWPTTLQSRVTQANIKKSALLA